MRIQLNSGFLLTACLEMIDCFENDRDFYLESIYENSIMSDNRKVVEEIIENQTNKMEELFRADLLPMNLDDLKYIEQKAIQEVNSQFADRTNDKTSFKPGMECYLEMIININEILESKKELNDNESNSYTKNLVDAMLQQVTEVESLTDDHLRNPALMDNLVELLESLVYNFIENTKGSNKCTPNSSRRPILRNRS
jgi:hypothetical protein